MAALEAKTPFNISRGSPCGRSQKFTSITEAAMVNTTRPSAAGRHGDAEHQTGAADGLEDAAGIERQVREGHAARLDHRHDLGGDEEVVDAAVDEKRAEQKLAERRRARWEG